MSRIFLFLLITTVIYGLPGKSNIEFLSIEQGRKAIVDESMELYFSLLLKREMQAKTASVIEGKTIEQQRDHCRSLYQREVLEFSDEEKKIIGNMAKEINEELKKNYPKIAIPWSFVKVSRKIEGGLPHTRARHIVLPKPFIEETISNRKQMMHVLLHEQMHVLQRIHPQKFAQLYKKWGFIKAKKIKWNSWLLDHQILNPDGTDRTWVYPLKGNRWILPLVIFNTNSTRPRMPRDMALAAIHLERKEDTFVIKKKKFIGSLFWERDYVRIFQKKASSHLYHPNEISAEYLTLVILYYHFSNRTDMTLSANRYVEGENWLKQNFTESEQ